MIESIFDLNILHAIRSHAHYYVHGHRAGGTNPSLVEAMFFGKPILAFDVVYNRETTKDEAYYYTDIESLRRLIERTTSTAHEPPRRPVAIMSGARLQHNTKTSIDIFLNLDYKPTAMQVVKKIST